MAGRGYMRKTNQKNSKNFHGAIYHKKRSAQTIRTDKGTASTGEELRDFCNSLNMKLEFGTPYIHTPTGLVERGIKTLKITHEI